MNGKGWSQYFDLGPAELLAGEDYTISMATGYENVYASVWIDFNDDFLLTADEMVVDNSLMEYPSNMYDVQITIPEDAADGLYLMRARTNGYGLCNDPCEEYNYGEAEDYLILIGEEQILPPTNLVYELFDEDVVLQWDAPATDELTGYNVYYSYESGFFEVLDNVTETTFTHASPGYGLHRYYVTGVYFTGESEPTNTIEVLITGLQSIKGQDFSIFPNPLSGNTLSININDPHQVESFTIINSFGQVLKSGKLECRYNTLDISNLNNGIYMVKIAYKNNSYQIEKLIVK